MLKPPSKASALGVAVAAAALSDHASHVPLAPCSALRYTLNPKP